MELIIEEIVDEICFLVSVGALTKDIYLDELTATLFEHRSV